MEEIIRNFPKQFAWDPVVENKETLRPFNKIQGGQAQGKKFLLCGMGGSAHAGNIIQTIDPSSDFIIHRDYGLPQISEDLMRDRLIIASSYSGNTEETLSAFEEAREKKLPLCAVAIGGKLEELAKRHAVPYIQIPNTGIQPRMALGFSVRALAKFMGRDDLLKESFSLSFNLDSNAFDNEGKALAKRLEGSIPLVYASRINFSIAYTWKIKFNESGKIPAFYNVFPELNHNEMTGFDAKESSTMLSERFYCIFLKDENDHPQIQKRMDATAKLYKEKGLKTEMLQLRGKTIFHKVFSSLALVDWVAYYTALHYGLDPEQVPMVEEFKKLIQ